MGLTILNMKKKIIIVVRYSLLLKNSSGAWNIGRDVSFEEYRATLFAEERLEQHQALFHHVTLQSILQQAPVSDDVEVELLIATSSELPADNMAYLDELSATHEFIHILKVAPHGNLGRTLKPYLDFSEDTIYMTVRLDDDDALATDFFKRCEKYLNSSFAGFIVTFASGYQARLENIETMEYCELEKVYYPSIALGLGFINRYKKRKERLVHKVPHIYAAGNHTRLQYNYPLIVDAQEPAFFRSLHGLSDTQGKVPKRQVVADDDGLDTFNIHFPHLKVQNE